MCVCMYVCMYVYMYVCMLMYVCMCVCVCVYVCMYVLTVAIETAVSHWEDLKSQGKVPQVVEEEDIYAHAKYGQEELDSDEGGMDIEWDEGEDEAHVAHVPVPSQKDIEDMLIRRRKKVSPHGVVTLEEVWLA